MTENRFDHRLEDDGRASRKDGELEFSILTPSFNYGQYVQSAVQSVLTQDETTELILMDGGSTDETIDLLAAMADPRLTWRSESDRGQSDALNKAFAMATKPWVGWLNVDEYYLPGALERVREEIRRRPDVDVFYGDVVLEDVDTGRKTLYAEHRFSPYVLEHYGCFIFTSSLFIRRSVLGETPWDASLRAMMDWDLLVRLHQGGARFGHIAAPLSAFRCHPDQVSNQAGVIVNQERELIRRRYGLPSGLRGRLERRTGLLLHQVYKAMDASRKRRRAWASTRPSAGR